MPDSWYDLPDYDDYDCDDCGDCPWCEQNEPDYEYLYELRLEARSERSLERGGY